MKECTTHHRACDCRERKFREMEQAVNQLKAAVEALKTEISAIVEADYFKVLAKLEGSKNAPPD